LPKMVCLRSSSGVRSKVIKNWLRFVLGPELAMATRPRRVNRSRE